MTARSADDREDVAAGLRVVGHPGDNTDVGRAEGRAAAELRVPGDRVDDARPEDEVVAFPPVGWRPIALALSAGASGFPADPGAPVVCSLVTDGEEMYGGNPCAAATAPE